MLLFFPPDPTHLLGKKYTFESTSLMSIVCLVTCTCTTTVLRFWKTDRLFLRGFNFGLVKRNQGYYSKKMTVSGRLENFWHFRADRALARLITKPFRPYATCRRTAKFLHEQAAGRSWGRLCGAVKGLQKILVDLLDASPPRRGQDDQWRWSWLQPIRPRALHRKLPPAILATRP